MKITPLVLLITVTFGAGTALASLITLPADTSGRNFQMRYAGLELVPLAAPKPEAPTKEPKAPAEPISFTTPLTVSGEVVIGKSLEQLIAGSPLFSPIEGLPDSVWKGKKCTDCHNWTAQALCTQGGTYLKEKTAMAINKQHPYGGGLKLNLKFWALQGCE